MIDATNPSQAGLPAGTNFVPGTEDKAAAALAAANANPEQAAKAAAEAAALEAGTKAPGVTLGAPEPEAKPVAPAGTAAVPGAGGEATYEPTGDVTLDYVLGFIGRQGFAHDHPAVVAAQSGNFGLLKAELATKGVAGANEVLALGEKIYADHTAKTKAQADATATEVATYATQAAGGQGNWATVRAWAAANAEPAEKAELNAMILKGGLQGRTAIDYIVKAYASKHTLGKEPAEAVARGATSQTGPGTEPMTAAAYAKAVRELSISLGGREVQGTAEYAALQAQRLAAKRSGY